MGDRKVAFVTGSSRGIGFEICTELVKKNYFVIGVCKDVNKQVYNEWRNRVSKNGELFSLDISDGKSVKLFFDDVMTSFSPPSVLINNAGITSDAFFHKMTYQQWKEVLDVNLVSIFNVTQPIYRNMLKMRYGRIINISSVNAQKGQAGQTNYCVSKAGVHGFTISLAQEAARSNITVNTVSPGYVDTQMTRKIRDEIRNSIMSEVPLKRFASPEEIAKSVLYLISDDARYITGANISINGGLHMY